MKRTSQKTIAGEKHVFFALFTCILVISLYPVSAQVSGTSAQQTGSIAISSVPYQTTVSLDNRQAGVTPVVLKGISPGTHTVLLTTPGYLPYSQQVTVQAGSVAQVYAILIQRPQDIPSAGTVKISSTPTAASIYIDNRLTGVSPTTINGISGGKHQVLLMKQGFEDYTAQITVINGTVTNFYAVLDPKRVTMPPSGSLRVTSTPSSAGVYLDNRLTGVTPETINGITPGLHQLRILKPGYLAVAKSVTVTDKQVTPVTVVLPVNPSIYF